MKRHRSGQQRSPPAPHEPPAQLQSPMELLVEKQMLVPLAASAFLAQLAACRPSDTPVCLWGPNCTSAGCGGLLKEYSFCSCNLILWTPAVSPCQAPQGCVGLANRAS